MNDYAATTIQPVAQGIIQIAQNTPLGAVSFQGRGISNIQRTPGAAPYFGAVQGDFILTLDQGLPGGGPAAVSAPGLNPALPPAVQPAIYADLRSELTARGQTFNPLVPPTTTLGDLAVTYLSGPNAFPAQPAGGPVVQIRVVCQIPGGAPSDPAGLNATGLEIVVWKVATSGGGLT